MIHNGSDKTVPPIPAIPPIPVGLEDLVGMAAASPDFAELLVARRGEAVAASGVALASTETAVLAAVDDATLSRMIATCRTRHSGTDRRDFLARASAAVLLLVGVAGCEPKTNGGSRQPGASPAPAMNPPAMNPPAMDPPAMDPPAMDPPAMRSAPKTVPDAGVVRQRDAPQVSAGVRPPRPRPMRPSGVKTGISPQHRRRQKLEVETGSRPD